LFAAANGNIVQLYSTWTFENLENFKGHNGKVRSLYWTPDDATLVSAGSDGAVYTWKILSQKRENEHIMKSCVYNCAVSSHSGRNVYAVGNDRMIKEIFESSVTKELDAGIILTQLAISTSGTMMFIGTTKGTIRAIRFPLGESGDFQEHPAHAKSVTKIRVSYDDQYLFSVAEDGCLYVFRISDRDDPRLKKDRTMIFADELLITKSDLEEKNVTTLELQRSLEELKLEHEYQLRLKDMNFNEKLKEVNEKYSQEIEGLKISTSILRTEKEKEEVKFHEQFHNLKSVQLQELHVIFVKIGSRDEVQSAINA
jgi:WD40 repeat protein